MLEPKIELSSIVAVLSAACLIFNIWDHKINTSKIKRIESLAHDKTSTQDLRMDFLFVSFSFLNFTIYAIFSEISNKKPAPIVRMKDRNLFKLRNEETTRTNTETHI